MISQILNCDKFTIPDKLALKLFSVSDKMRQKHFIVSDKSFIFAVNEKS